MKTKTKIRRARPLSFSQAISALEQALELLVIKEAGPAWKTDPFIWELENDVYMEVGELFEAIDRCHDNVLRLAKDAKLMAEREAAARKRAAAKKPSATIVTARNPRKIRRDGATR